MLEHGNRIWKEHFKSAFHQPLYQGCSLEKSLGFYLQVFAGVCVRDDVIVACSCLALSG